MLWLDRALAWPTLGLIHEPVIQSSHELATALRPFMESLIANDVAFGVKSESPLALQIAIHDGRTITVKPDKVLLEFEYAAYQRNPAGAFPTIEVASEQRPYSQVLDGLLADLTSILTLLNDSGVQRATKQFGIIAACRLERGTLPPGVEAMLDHVAAPWGEAKDLLKLSTHVLMPVPGSKTDLCSDRCHHIIDVSASREDGEDVAFKLDFQRNWDPALCVPTTESECRNWLNQTAQSAVLYFDSVGLGEFYDE